MTAEILILTPSAIVMAADSAVTVDNIKTYNGVNKLFMLSNNPPIGIMIYNSAEFLRMPFETLIKDFRKKIESKNKNTLKEVSEDFQDYLKDFVKKAYHKKTFDEQLDFFISNIMQESKNILESDMLKSLNKTFWGIKF